MTSEVCHAQGHIGHNQLVGSELSRGVDPNVLHDIGYNGWVLNKVMDGRNTTSDVAEGEATSEVPIPMPPEIKAQVDALRARQIPKPSGGVPRHVADQQFYDGYWAEQARRAQK